MDPQQIERLVDQLQEQFKQHSFIQDEIGHTSETKQQKGTFFVESIINFAKEQVHQAEREKQAILKESQNAQSSILSYKKLMGEFASNTAVLDPSKSLHANLEDLRHELIQVQERYNERLTHVQDLYHQLQDFKQAMTDFADTSMLTEDQIDVSSLAVNSLEEEIARCEVEYVRRKDKVEEGAKQMSNLFIMLGLQPEVDRDRIIHQFYREHDPSEKMHLCNMLVSKDFMAYLDKRIGELEEQKRHTEARKDEITQSLKHLWNRLHIDPQECEVFLMANRGLTAKELQKFENELAKLNSMKQERIGDFILTAREDLKALWDQLYFSEEQKKKFHYAYTDESTDTVLEALENEISRLQLEFEDSKYILERVEKHMKLKKEVEEFEATTSDPNRLFGKGQRDPGRLLREEKFRKRISREIPKVVKELEGSLLEYEALKGQPFLVYGKPYFDVIYEDNNDQQSETTAVEKPIQLPSAPRTPRREGIQQAIRRPMTSPRTTKTKRFVFNTPQANRVKSFGLSSVVEPKIDTSDSILHRVRAKNSRKQKPIKRGHIFDDSDSDEQTQDENTALSRAKPQRAKKPKGSVESQYESDDNIGLDLGIFDDGPDLSDMSEVEA